MEQYAKTLIYAELAVVYIDDKYAFIN